MSRFTVQARNAVETAMNLAVLGALGYVAAFPYIEMQKSGVSAASLSLTALAAAVPAAVALVAADIGAARPADRSTRFFYPPCAALLASCVVSIPVYLMGPAIA